MSQARPKDDRVLERTPALEGLLVSLRRSIRRQVLWYGIGTVLGAVALWLTFAFLADWGLRVPRAIRIFHGIVLPVVIGFFAWRDLVKPLLRVPHRYGLAVLLERANPDLRELLISAVQFQGKDALQGDPTLVTEVVRQAEERARSLSHRGVIDAEAPRARFLLGSGGILALAVLGFFHPLQMRTFLNRLFGGSAAWPQRTELVLEIPGIDPTARVENTAESMRLRLARGTDVAVLIQAKGVVPEEVTLHFEGGRDLVLNPTGGEVFRTLLRSCQEDLAFHVTGGDDQDGLPRVSIEVLEPPDLEGVAIAIQPPAYTRLAPSVVFNRDVEVLRGSELSVHVLPSPREANGVARLLPEDTTLALERAPFPREAAPAAATEATPEPDGLAFQLTAERSLGFRIELTDADGLENPDPGLFRIQVVEDRPPEVQVLAPAKSEFEIVRGGAVPLRARAEDDFGLVAMGWRVRAVRAGVSGEGEEPVRSGEFELERFERGAGTPAGEKNVLRDGALGNARIEVDELGTSEVPVAVDSRFEFEFYARDNRMPEPAEGHSLAVRARVITPEELLRRMQDRLAQARLDALRLSDLQREKRTRLEELLDSLGSDETLETGESLALAAVLSGERRVLAESQSLARDLASITEDILYARLDEKAGPLLEFYDARARKATDLRFQAGPWRELSRASTEGSVAPAGFASSLVALVALALEISEDHVRAAVEALDSAEKALDASAVQTALELASASETRALERLETLLEELSEWDNFQNILTLARDILNRQKALRERTQQFASEK